ncbi:MAG TPA: protoporphyrinogen oxidase [Actinomycetota bacterium]|nr:protoporphyrinogen oxidase [Actinomycetota bacterium]
MRRPVVAVIGGGVTGLGAVVTIEEAAGDQIRTVLFESSTRLGGVIRGGKLGGVYVEDGPDSFIERDGYMLEWCRRLGIEDRLTEPAIFGALIYDGRAIRPMPAGSLFGIPPSAHAARRSGLVSFRGALRALGDHVLPGPLKGPDVSVESYLTGRLGREVVERMVDPLLAGARSGDVGSLSLAAALPDIDRIARSRRGVMRGIRRGARSTGAELPRFRSFDKGMPVLVRALSDHCRRADVRVGEAVTRIERSGKTFVVRSGTRRLRADAIIIATPAPHALGLLTPVLPDAVPILATVEHASVAVVSLLYAQGRDALPESGSGVLIPSSAERVVSACTFYSRKWPVSDPGGDALVLRAVVARDPAGVLDHDDRSLSKVVDGDLREVLGLRAPAASARVTRWSEALPRYEVGHLDRMRELDAIMATAPGIALAGSSYGGPGIPDCLRSGSAAATRILSHVLG